MRRALLLSSGLHALALAAALGLRPPPLAEPDEPARLEVIFGDSVAAAAPAEAATPPVGHEPPRPDPGPIPQAAPVARPDPPAPPAEARPPGYRVDRPDPTLIPARDRPGNRGPAYPRAAWERRETGKVVLRLHIGPDGVVTRVETLRSSGVASLDEAAIEALSTWRFVPAERDGRPVASYRDQPIEFVLE
jgi:protein TonB